MEKELMNKIVELMPRIKNRDEIFTEEEMPIIKEAFYQITDIKWGNMMTCGGKLCEDIRRSIVNYMRQFAHVKQEQPKKKVKPLVIPKEYVAKNEEVVETWEAEKTTKDLEKYVDENINEEIRNELMATALEIAEEKGIRKPHPKSGVEKLNKYIAKNR